MARMLGPDANSRLVYRKAGGVLRSAAGAVAVVWAAATGDTRADILAYNGTPTPGVEIVNSELTVDDDSLLPLFWFPEDVDTVYVSVTGGTRVAVNADYDARLDATITALAAKPDLAVWAEPGDLLIGTAAGPPQILPVGPDGTSLVADSTAETGVRWDSTSMSGSILAWTGTDYAPTALKTNTARPRIFIGPVDPSIVPGIVMSPVDWHDTWIGG